MLTIILKESSNRQPDSITIMGKVCFLATNLRIFRAIEAEAKNTKKRRKAVSIKVGAVPKMLAAQTEPKGRTPLRIR